MFWAGRSTHLSRGITLGSPSGCLEMSTNKSGFSQCCRKKQACIGFLQPLCVILALEDMEGSQKLQVKLVFVWVVSVLWSVIPWN